MLRKSQKIGCFGPFRCLAPRHAIQVFPILQEKGRQVDCNQVIRAKWSQKFQDSPKIYFYTSGMIADCPRTPMGRIPRDASGKKKQNKSRLSRFIPDHRRYSGMSRISCFYKSAKTLSLFSVVSESFSYMKQRQEISAVLARSSAGKT